MSTEQQLIAEQLRMVSDKYLPKSAKDYIADIDAIEHEIRFQRLYERAVRAVEEMNSYAQQWNAGELLDAREAGYVVKEEA